MRIRVPAREMELEAEAKKNEIKRHEEKVFRLDTPGVRHFMEAYRASMDVLEQAGYQRFRGTPVGYLFDIPAISAEASRLVDRVSKEKPDRDWYQSMLHLDDDGIELTVSFPRK
jgi:hypothetical protein